MIPVEDELIGKEIGNYVLMELLGKGGMGSVYRAEHPRIEKQVAVKILSEHFLQQPMAAQRFESEARLISRIDHPNIIEIFDFGTLEDGRLYYVMEMLKGQELRKVMKKKRRMPPAVVLPYLEQICAALQAAHDQGVIHRDLKPENIFVLDRDPLALKVLDFGVAKLLETNAGVETTAAGVVVGTPLLVAPEQAASQPDKICQATDLYSLGVLLYWILSGRPPFVADAPGILMAMHIMDDPPLITDRNPNIPIKVARVIHKCLQKDPAKRPASADEVYASFAKAVAESEASDESDASPIIELSTAMDPWGMSADSDVLNVADSASISGEVEVCLTGPQPMSITGPPMQGLAPTPPLPAGPPTGPQPVLTPAPSVTTQSGSSGEVAVEAQQGSRRMTWVVVGVVALALVLGVSAVMVHQGKSTSPAASAPPSAVTAPPAKPKPAPPPAPEKKAPPAAVQRTATVEVQGGGAICRFKSRDAIKELTSPCTHKVDDGDEVQITVSSEGHAPFSKTWKAGADLALKLRIDAGGKKIVEQGAAVARQDPGATKKPGKKKPRKRKKKPKKKFVPVGEGTMKVDL